MRALVLALCLLATLALPGCSGGKLMDALSEGLSNEVIPPFEGLQGPAREAWLGPLAPLATDSDMAELQLAFEEVPGGQTRRWVNFDTGAKWSVTPQGLDAATAGGPARRALAVRAESASGETARGALAAEQIEKDRWQTSPLEASRRDALLRLAE